MPKPLIPARHARRAKIVATLGPASTEPAIIRALFDAGVDVFRLNASHGSHDDHARRYATLRDLERGAGHPISVLMDLQGPKLRVGAFAAGHAALGRAPRSGSTSTRRRATRPACRCRIPSCSRRSNAAPRCCWTTAACACA